MIAANPFDFRTPNQWVDWDVPELPPPVHSAEEIARVLDLADEEALDGTWKAARLRAIVYTYAFTGTANARFWPFRQPISTSTWASSGSGPIAAAD